MSSKRTGVFIGLPEREFIEGVGTLERVGEVFSTGGEDNFEGIGICTGNGRTGTGVIVANDGSAVTGGG